jgi:anti-anti-sigma regulatory factor
MDKPPRDAAEGEAHELREHVMRLLRVEADLFRRNEQLDAQWRIYRSLSELGKRLHGRLGETEIAAVSVHFVLYALNVERCVVGLRDGARVRVVAWDGYYDEALARTIAALSFDAEHPLFNPVAPGQRQRLCSLPAVPGERDAIGRTFELDEHVWLPLREGPEEAMAGFLLAGNSAAKARHHGRIIADDPVVLALDNLVELMSAALRSARLDQALRVERDRLEVRVRERTKEREQLLSEIIRTQEQRLEELSTPILPIADHILVMPLIGTMDGQRSAQLQCAALEGAAARRAKFVILDVTGVKDADASFAKVLLGTAAGLRLLGVRAVITGIRPDVALALVNLDTDLEAVVTRSTLQSGIAYAMGRSGAPNW